MDFEGSWAAFKKLTEEVIYFDYFCIFCLFVVVVVDNDVDDILFPLHLPSLFPVIKFSVESCCCSEGRMAFWSPG